MSVVGKVESLWRYPVKSMRGEELTEAFVGFGGLHGDRVYAVHNSGAREEFPYLTAREQGQMLLYRPILRKDSTTALDVEIQSGKTVAVEDNQLLQELGKGIREDQKLSLLKSENAIADCSPISILSVQTVAQLSDELGRDVDKRRFRANIYLELLTLGGFAEDTFVGRRLRIGPEVVVDVMQRDGRCKMITLDPDTAEPDPQIMKLVARNHESHVGIYANVVAEGAIKLGAAVTIFD